MSKNNKNNNNHVVFLIDASTSMGDFKGAVQQFFEDQINSLKKSSKRYKQDVLVSLFYFSSKLSSPEFFRSALSNISNINDYSPVGNTGVKGTNKLFTISAEKLNKTKKVLKELNPSQYHFLPVNKTQKIKDFVESWTGETYRVGSAYYQFTKPETIQSGKQICVQDKLDGRVYSGTNARSLLGLPDYGVKVDPAAHPKYTIFVQSTSTNRNLVPGTSLIVIR